MARIIYGVAGQGFGHSSRSHLIGQHLIDAGHEVLFAASRQSLSYLRRHFGEQVKEIVGLGLVYRNGHLVPLQTISTNLSRFLANRVANRELYRGVFEPFYPDLVISDFEPFSAWWAWRHGVPFINIDHQHLLTLCELDHPSSGRLSRLNAQAVTRCHACGAVAYLIPNFFRTPTRHPRAVVAPPVVRPIVESLLPTTGEHILIYTTDTSWRDGLTTMLNSLRDQSFHIYGFDEDRHVGNCRFKRTSTPDFLHDLASCRGVVATAGFSLLSECLYLRKKMLLLPVQGQYEQIVNARYAERFGVALNRRLLNAEVLLEYQDFLRDPIADCDEILWPNNHVFFNILRRTIDKVCPTDRFASAPASATTLLG